MRVGELNISIPARIKSNTNEINESHILIGSNGSGKSELLKKIAQKFHSRGYRVVVVANSIHDKFPKYSRNYFALRDRSGRMKAHLAIKRALKSIDINDFDRLKSIMKTLNYVKFDSKLGIRAIDLSIDTDKLQKLARIARSGSISEPHEFEILINKLMESKWNDTFWITMEDFSFKDMQTTVYLWLVKYENVLKKEGVLKGLEFFLSRNKTKIPILKASSGELGIVSTLLFLGAVVEHNTVILIDEPENSLHPKWQKQYVTMILDNFYLKTPKLVIATHSPLIVNGEDLVRELTHIYKANNFKFEPIDNHTLNIEAAYADYFDVVTPANRMLSNRLVELLNDFEQKKISEELLNKNLEEFEIQSYDDRQNKLIRGVREIVKDLKG